MAHLECQHGGAPEFRIVRDAGEAPQDPAEGTLLALVVVSGTGASTITPVALRGQTTTDRLVELEKRFGELHRGVLDFLRQHPERLGL